MSGSIPVRSYRLESSLKDWTLAVRTSGSNSTGKRRSFGFNFTTQKSDSIPVFQKSPVAVEVKDMSTTSLFGKHPRVVRFKANGASSKRMIRWCTVRKLFESSYPFSGASYSFSGWYCFLWSKLELKYVKVLVTKIIIYLLCSCEFCLSLWFVSVKKMKAPTPTTIGTKYIRGCVIFDMFFIASRFLFYL